MKKDGDIFGSFLSDTAFEKNVFVSQKTCPQKSDVYKRQHLTVYHAQNFVVLQSGFISKGLRPYMHPQSGANVKNSQHPKSYLTHIFCVSSYGDTKPVAKICLNRSGTTLGHTGLNTEMVRLGSSLFTLKSS